MDPLIINFQAGYLHAGKPMALLVVPVVPDLVPLVIVPDVFVEGEEQMEDLPAFKGVLLDVERDKQIFV